jgi:hypothetical protein
MFWLKLLTIIVIYWYLVRAIAKFAAFNELSDASETPRRAFKPIHRPFRLEQSRETQVQGREAAPRGRVQRSSEGS